MVNGRSPSFVTYLKPLSIFIVLAEEKADFKELGKSGWRSGHQSRLPPLLQMLYVG